MYNPTSPVLVDLISNATSELTKTTHPQDKPALLKSIQDRAKMAAELKLEVQYNCALAMLRATSTERLAQAALIEDAFIQAQATGDQADMEFFKQLTHVNQMTDQSLINEVHLARIFGQDQGFKDNESLLQGLDPETMREFSIFQPTM